MVLGINNFFDARNKNAKVADFQDLDHLDGVSVSAVSANLYNQKRDDLVMFYFISEMELIMRLCLQNLVLCLKI